MSDTNTTIQELKDLVDSFKKERNWGSGHTLRNLATSIAIEGAELLEHFQWTDEMRPTSSQEVQKELADVVIYCLFFSLAADIDLTKVVKEKMAHNAKKYPAQLFKSKKVNPDEYYRIKQAYRENELLLSNN